MTNHWECFDTSIISNNILFASQTHFSIYIFIFSIIFLSHIYHITKSITVIISNNISNNTISKQTNYFLLALKETYYNKRNTFLYSLLLFRIGSNDANPLSPLLGRPCSFYVFLDASPFFLVLLLVVRIVCTFAFWTCIWN